jgi:hypothetical protein
MRLLHIDCPYCGQDNLLPAELVQARQRQYELEQRHYALKLQEQERLRVAQEKEKQHKQKLQRLLIWLLVGGFFGFGLLGSCVALGIWASEKEEQEALRTKDPKVNGQALMLARFAEMREKQGCERILVQPTTHRDEPGKVSLDMNKGDHCVHILGYTGTGAMLSVKYDGRVALTQPLPAAASSVDYRLCASETATHPFEISATPAQPFTVAALECPRLPAEGGARSREDDPRKSGKERLMSLMAELVQAGCKDVVSQPKVSRGEQTFTLTSPANSNCYNLLAASYYSDVKLSATLRDPEGKALPVPEPDSKIRVAYCAPKAGKYTLVLSPSTGDHYSHVALDCPRFGREGLKRLKTLNK